MIFECGRLAWHADVVSALVWFSPAFGPVSDSFCCSLLSSQCFCQRAREIPMKRCPTGSWSHRRHGLFYNPIPAPHETVVGSRNRNPCHTMSYPEELMAHISQIGGPYSDLRAKKVRENGCWKEFFEGLCHLQMEVLDSAPGIHILKAQARNSYGPHGGKGTCIPVRRGPQGS